MHTHKVVFANGDDVDCAVRALLGQSTKAIMEATGLTEGQVTYRIAKAQINRWDFRHGKTPLAQRMIEIGRGPAAHIVNSEIAPKFRKLADR